MARNQDQELTRPVLPTAATVKFAQDLVHRLAGPQGRFALVDRETNKTTEIDETFYRLIQQLLVNLAQNRAVSIIPIAHELTTHQAAEVLNVSRPFLVGLLDKGAIRTVRSAHTVAFASRTYWTIRRKHASMERKLSKS